MKIPALLLLGATIALSDPGPRPLADSAAPSAAEAQSFFETILGAWTGEGELFGQPAGFEMTWSLVLDDRFVRLDYSILGQRPMDAVGHYRLGDGEPPVGVWVDSRGEILDLEGTVSAGRLETIWRSPTERGRTVYELMPDGTLAVADFYHDGSGWQPFGSARYTRVP